VRRASKSPDKGPWAEWTDRMAQKSALHRVAKRMPILDQRLADALRREDDDLAPDTEPVATQPPQSAPSRPQKPSVLNKLELAAPAAEPIRVVMPEPVAVVPASAPIESYDEGEVL
jgi:recombinational DNA repair protein RecT